MATEEEVRARRLVSHKCVVVVSDVERLVLPLNTQPSWKVGSLVYEKKPCRSESSVSDYVVSKVGGAWRCECGRKGCAHVPAVELDFSRRMRQASEREALVLTFLQSRLLFVPKERIVLGTGLPAAKVGAALAALVKAKKVAKYVSGLRVGVDAQGRKVGKRYRNLWGANR